MNFGSRAQHETPGLSLQLDGVRVFSWVSSKEKRFKFAINFLENVFYQASQSTCLVICKIDIS